MLRSIFYDQSRRAARHSSHTTLFQRDLLPSFEEFDKPLSAKVIKYFLKYASNWLCGKYVAFSLYSNSPPLAIDAVTTFTLLPSSQNDNTTTLLKRFSRLKHFFTNREVATRVTRAPNWAVENNSRTQSTPNTSLNRTDIKLPAYFCYVK